MSMKFSDILQDLATGDASAHDVYAEQASGKIDVLEACFNAANAFANADSSEINDEVIEAFQEQGIIPETGSMKEKKIYALEYAAAARATSLPTLLDAATAVSKAIASSANKNKKAFGVIARKLNVEFKDDGSSYMQVAKGILNGEKSLTSEDTWFPKPQYLTNLLNAYAQIICAISCVAGSDVSSEVSKWVNCSSAKSCDTLPAAMTTLKNANAVAQKNLKQVLKKDNGVSATAHTKTLSAADIAKIITSIYAAQGASEVVTSSFKENRANNVETMKNLVSNGKEVSANQTDMAVVKEVKDTLMTIKDELVKAMGDATSTIVHAAN